MYWKKEKIAKEYSCEGMPDCKSFGGYFAAIIFNWEDYGEFTQYKAENNFICDSCLLRILISKTVYYQENDCLSRQSVSNIYRVCA